MGIGGASKKQQNAKFEKNVDPLNSAAPFLSILVENGSQDGGQTLLKMDLKIDSKFYNFLDRFFDAFWKGFWSQNGRKIDAKTTPKHAGIDLEVELAKT